MRIQPKTSQTLQKFCHVLPTGASASEPSNPSGAGRAHAGGLCARRAGARGRGGLVVRPHVPLAQPGVDKIISVVIFKVFELKDLHLPQKPQT